MNNPTLKTSISKWLYFLAGIVVGVMGVQLAQKSVCTKIIENWIIENKCGSGILILKGENCER